MDFKVLKKIFLKDQIHLKNENCEKRQIIKNKNYDTILPDCYARTVTFCDFLSNFRKNTAKNTTKPGNSPGLLHFFDFFVTVRESLPGVLTVNKWKTAVIKYDNYESSERTVFIRK